MTYNPQLIAKIDPTPGQYIEPKTWPEYVQAVRREAANPKAYPTLGELPQYHLKKSLWRSAVKGVYVEEDIFNYGKQLAEKASERLIDAVLFSSPDADAQEIQYHAVTPCILMGDEDVRTVIERFMEPMIEQDFQMRWEGQ